MSLRGAARTKIAEAAGSIDLGRGKHGDTMRYDAHGLSRNTPENQLATAIVKFIRERRAATRAACRDARKSFQWPNDIGLAQQRRSSNISTGVKFQSAADAT